jgi:hypothetical protein
MSSRSKKILFSVLVLVAVGVAIASFVSYRVWQRYANRPFLTSIFSVPEFAFLPSWRSNGPFLDRNGDAMIVDDISNVVVVVIGGRGNGSDCAIVNDYLSTKDMGVIDFKGRRILVPACQNRILVIEGQQVEDAGAVSEGSAWRAVHRLVTTNHPDNIIESLIAGGDLPATFGRGTIGPSTRESFPEATKPGRWHDSCPASLDELHRTT